MRKLPRLVAEAEVNKKSKIVVWRNEKKVTKNVLIAELKEDKVANKKDEEKKKLFKKEKLKS